MDKRLRVFSEMLSPFSTAEIHRKGRQKPSNCLTPFHWPWQQFVQPSLLLHSGKSSLLPLTWLVALAELGGLQSGQDLGPDAIKLVYQGSSREVHTMKTKPNLPELLIRETSWKKGNFFSLKTKCLGNFIMLFQVMLLPCSIRQHALQHC